MTDQVVPETPGEPIELRLTFPWWWRWFGSVEWCLKVGDLGPEAGLVPATIWREGRELVCRYERDPQAPLVLGPNATVWLTNHPSSAHVR